MYLSLYLIGTQVTSSESAKSISTISSSVLTISTPSPSERRRASSATETALRIAQENCFCDPSTSINYMEFIAAAMCKRISIDDVETYNIISKKWIILEELPYYRFRFPAVAYDELEKIYAFGGQVGFNTTCNCFATTNEITIFTEKFGTLPTTVTNDTETETKPTSNNTTTNKTKPTSTSSSFLITFF